MARGKSNNLIVMGVDPGFAKMGVAVIRRAGQHIQLLHGRVVKTKKADKKQRSGLRVTNDDLRRYTELEAALDEMVEHEVVGPTAIGVEAYVLNKGQEGSASGAKSFGVYVGTLFWARTHGLFVAPFIPQDLKRRFCGRQSASKADVEAAVCDEVGGLAELLDSIPKGQCEHVADAVGCALLAMEELDQLRKAMGI